MEQRKGFHTLDAKGKPRSFFIRLWRLELHLPSLSCCLLLTLLHTHTQLCFLLLSHQSCREPEAQFAWPGAKWRYWAPGSKPRKTAFLFLWGSFSTSQGVFICYLVIPQHWGPHCGVSAHLSWAGACGQSHHIGVQAQVPTEQRHGGSDPAPIQRGKDAPERMLPGSCGWAQRTSHKCKFTKRFKTATAAAVFHSIHPFVASLFCYC